MFRPESLESREVQRIDGPPSSEHYELGEGASWARIREPKS